MPKMVSESAVLSLLQLLCVDRPMTGGIIEQRYQPLMSDNSRSTGNARFRTGGRPLKESVTKGKAIAMAGSQFATPPRVSPSKSVRKFTLSEANKTLPLVKRIVADIVRVNGEATSLQERVDALDEGRDRTAAKKELEGRVTRLSEIVDELSDVGAELKDPKTGLIDFVGRHEGHDVFLCWKLGEEKISFWHEMTAGFAGRKPVSQLRERE